MSNVWIVKKKEEHFHFGKKKQQPIASRTTNVAHGFLGEGRNLLGILYIFLSTCVGIIWSVNIMLLISI